MPDLPTAVDLSVIVACHDVGPYVRDTVRSVTAGLDDPRSPRTEVILVDDASTDGTTEILAAAAERHPDVQLIAHPENRGVSATRNAGLAQARGSWIAFLDGDDVVLPGYYASLVEAAQRLDCDLIKTDHVQVTGRDRRVHRIAYGPRGRAGDPRRGILPVHRTTAVDYPFVWAGLYHRRLRDSGLLRFEESLRTCEDRVLTWRLHLHARSFAVLGLAGVYYRRAVATSLTQIVDERQLDFLPAYLMIIDEVAADPDAESLLPKAMRTFVAVLCHHLRRRELFGAAGFRELRRRAGAMLDELPAETLRATVDELDHERRALIDRLPRNRRD